MLPNNVSTLPKGSKSAQGDHNHFTDNAGRPLLTTVTLLLSRKNCILTYYAN